MVAARRTKTPPQIRIKQQQGQGELAGKIVLPHHSRQRGDEMGLGMGIGFSHEPLFLSTILPERILEMLYCKQGQ
jgi:hypothetical protein